MAQVSSQIIALPRGEPHAPPSLYSPKIAAWLPLASVLAGIVTLFYIAQTSELTNMGYSIQELQNEQSNWELRNEQLALELAKAQSLAAVESDASKRLLMVRPKSTVYLQLDPEDPAKRSIPSSRGEPRAVPVLGKTAPRSANDLLEPVGASLSSLLAPRSQQSQR